MKKKTTRNMTTTISTDTISGRVMMNFRYVFLVLFLILFLSACGTDQSETSSAPAQIATSQPASITVAERVKDTVILQKGEALFLKNCSQCHGRHAEGTKEWKTPDADGRYPPPPLNGTAHAWHHSTEVLIEVIKDGSMPEGNMPSWEEKLTDDEIRAVIAWFQSFWPEDTFKIWQNLDLESRQE